MTRYAIEYIKVGYRADNTPIFIPMLRFISSGKASPLMILPLNLLIVPKVIWSIVHKLKVQDIKRDVLLLMPSPEYDLGHIDIEDYIVSNNKIWGKIAEKVPEHTILLTISSSGIGLPFIKYMRVKGVLEEHLKNANIPVIWDAWLLDKLPYNTFKHKVDDVLILKIPEDYDKALDLLILLLQLLNVLEISEKKPESIIANLKLKGNRIHRIFYDKSGFVVYHIKAGDYVEKGQTIADIKGFFGETIGQVKTPINGLIVSLKTFRIIKPGDLIVELVT